MVTTPNSLVSKVLKAKYYPHESIFRCKIKQNSSWIWQSLMGERNLVEKGTYRKIGNGKSTKIWEDKWIPGNSQGKPTSAKPQHCTVNRVEELIQNYRWKRPLLFKLFKEEEAKRIMRIPSVWLIKKIGSSRHTMGMGSIQWPQLIRNWIAKETWHLTPLHWDGIEDQRGDFKKW
ncbi:uncharacterized protein [Coffea arabica]|uniref:Uncharacterized protein n=1 Tax=Coffea arabica TaxID=13443 RepID=A0ABM4VZC9_COFAR